MKVFKVFGYIQPAKDNHCNTCQDLATQYDVSVEDGWPFGIRVVSKLIIQLYSSFGHYFNASVHV
jgi:hypothetical protein